MSRPRKCRRVCSMPAFREFMPAAPNAEGSDPVVLTVDEYEAIRLIDKENLSQEECSQSMEVARTTVQQIYNDARKKIARVLTEGLPLKIEGGPYRICEKSEMCCNCQFCRKRCLEKEDED